MRRLKRILLTAGIVSLLGCAALFLTMTMTATAGSGKMQPGCFPGQEDQTDPGDTHAKVSDGYIQTATFEFQGKSGEVKTKGWIRANMAFDVFDGDSMQGYLVADFYVNGSGPGHFESKCIIEAGTEEDGTECEDTCFDASDRFEAEFEGTVTGLPAKKGPLSAVGQLAGFVTPGGTIHLHLEIEKGVTCNDTEEDMSVSGENSESHAGKTSGNVSADDVEAGRIVLCV